MAGRLEYHRLDVYTKLTRVLRKLDEEIAFVVRQEGTL